MEKQEVVKTEAEGLLSKLIGEYTLEVTETNGAFQIVIKTEEAPTIIGRHGETIRAIQKYLKLSCIKSFRNQYMFSST